MVGSTCRMNDKTSLCRLSWPGLLGNRGCRVRCTGTKEQSCNHTSQKTRYRFQKAATLNMNADPECPFDVHFGNPYHNTKYCSVPREALTVAGKLRSPSSMQNGQHVLFWVHLTTDMRPFLQRETT